MPNGISAIEFKKLLQTGQQVDLIDVRTPAEFGEIHVECAKNEPLDRLDPLAIQAGRNGTAHQPLYVICRSGARGKQACEKFIAAGVSDVINIEGGTMACEAAGIPVVRGKKAIPLNCQVQILSGTLVVIGTALAYWVHPYWLVLPTFIGAGLIFSGVTNTCAMGTMLARMPWNQVSTACSTQPGSNATCCNK